MANTFNGVGTTFYGQSRFEQDGSFVTTKWFVIGFFPLVPMGSARVRYLGTSGVPFLARTSSFELVEDVPLHWMQVLKTWTYACFIVALTTSMMVGSAHPVAKIIVISAGIFLPFFLRFLARRIAGA